MFKLQSKITPFLWYDHQAGAAAALDIELFGSGRVVHTQHWGEGTPYQADSAMAVSIEVHGQPLIAFNGGPHFKLKEAASLFVR
jgi:predicted 3-demethylubiquinone-9 3-methyltransferase (glyoxalase superfamily)